MATISIRSIIGECVEGQSQSTPSPHVCPVDVERATSPTDSGYKQPQHITELVGVKNNPDSGVGYSDFNVLSPVPSRQSSDFHRRILGGKSLAISFVWCAQTIVVFYLT